MASLGGLLGKDNLSCLFQRVKVETNFPLKGPVITAKIIGPRNGF